MTQSVVKFYLRMICLVMDHQLEGVHETWAGVEDFIAETGRVGYAGHCLRCDRQITWTVGWP